MSNSQTDIAGPRGIKRKLADIDANDHQNSGNAIKRLRSGSFDVEQLSHTSEQTDGPSQPPLDDAYGNDGKPIGGARFEPSKVPRLGPVPNQRADLNGASNAIESDSDERYGWDFDEADLANLRQMADEAQSRTEDEKLLVFTGPVHFEDTYGNDGMPIRDTHFETSKVQRLGPGSNKSADLDDAGNAIKIDSDENYGWDFDKADLANLHQMADEAQSWTEDEKLLVFDGPVHSHRPDQGSFLTRKQYEKKYSRWLDQDELDARSVLIRDDATRSYLPKVRVYTKMITEEGGRDKFNARMDQLGLSRKPFNEGVRDVPMQDRFYDTPAGIRERRRLFKYPQQAGEKNPDIVLRNSEGEFIGIYPKLEGVECLQELTDFYGAKNVWLKTSGNVYKTPEVYNAETKVRPQTASNKKIGAAEMAFAKFTDQIYEVKRDDLPKVLVRLETGVYGNRAHYDLMLKGWETETWRGSQLNNTKQIELRPEASERPELIAELNRDLFNRDVLILAPNGAGYVSPRALRDEYPESYFKKTMRDANLPEELANVRGAAAPELLLRKSNHMFVAGEIAMEEAKEQRTILRNIYLDGQIFVQRKDERGRFTGKFAELEFCLKAGKPLSETQIEQLDLDPKKTLHYKLEPVKPPLLIRLHEDEYVTRPEYDKFWRYQNLDGGRAEEPDATGFDVLLLDQDERSYLSPGEVRKLYGERFFGQLMREVGLPEILADKPPSNVPSLLVQINADSFVSREFLKDELAESGKPLVKLYPASDIFVRENNWNNEVKFTDLQTFRERGLVFLGEQIKSLGLPRDRPRDLNMEVQNLANDLSEMTIHDPDDRSAQSSLRGLETRPSPNRTAFSR